MMSKKHVLITAILLATGFQLFAQNEVATNTTVVIKEKKIAETTTTPDENGGSENYNYLKLNLTGLVLKNYSLQFERTLSKKISASVAFRMMPNSGLPFKSQLVKSAGENDNSTIDLINNLELSNFAITPELRIYLGKKGYGRGFYIAPFYRYASFKTNNLPIDFVGDTGEDKSLNLSGNLTSNTAGILFGAQWALGKRMCIDWWIAGPHYGVAKGTFAGISNPPLSQREQDELYRQINNLEIPLTEKTVSVNANGALMTLDGPWGGVRAGLSLGVRF